MNALNDLHQQLLLTTFRTLHQQLSELEGLLAQMDHPSPFFQVAADLSPVDRRVVRGYFTRLRETMLELLQAQGVPLPAERRSLRWALQTGMLGIHVVIDEFSPSKLRGYGELSDQARISVERIQQRLNQLVEQVSRFLSQSSSAGMAATLGRIADDVPGLTAVLTRLDDVLTRHGLVDYRLQFDSIVDRLRRMQFEIALFGRVSSGKSSLMNHIVGRDVLPVGITPVTAVPTRVTWGEQPSAVVEFAESQPREIDVSQLADFVSEERNPGNAKHVRRVEVRLPSSRLQEGIVFVDTPGIGSLARWGSAESLAYLPRCDLGVVLLDASSTLNDEDIGLIHSLRTAGTPAQVLLSKADLLAEADRRRMLTYVERQLRDQFDAVVPVYTVSIIGADETLLDQWFTDQLRPLGNRRSELTLESLSRKVVQLAQAVSTDLQRRQDVSPQVDQAEASLPRLELETLLEKGDDVLREIQDYAREWRYANRVSSDDILDDAAEFRIGSRGGRITTAAVLRDMVVDVQNRRAQEVRRRLNAARERLATSVAETAEVARVASVEAGTGVNFGPDDMPIPEWNAPTANLPEPPLWTPLCPPLARRYLRHRLNAAARAEVSDAVDAFDRKIERWAHESVLTIRRDYEARTGMIRSRLRRPLSTDDEARNRDGLAEDIAALRRIATPNARREDEADESESADFALETDGVPAAIHPNVMGEPHGDAVDRLGYSRLP